MPRNKLAVILLCGAFAAWQIYEIATATEAPSPAQAMLQYIIVIFGLVGFGGGIMFYALGKR